MICFIAFIAFITFITFIAFRFVFRVSDFAFFATRNYLLQGSGSGFLHSGGSYVTLTDGTDFSIVIEKMAWAHSQWLAFRFEYALFA